MSEFVATHRYNGEDDFVPYFSKGDEVRFVEEFAVSGLNAVYERADGTVQVVYKHCMEPI